MRQIIILAGLILMFASTAFASDISVEELHERLAKGEDVLLVDVREPYEHQEFNIGGILIPLGNISGPDGQGPAELKDHKNDEIVIYDRSSNRSGMAQMELTQRGFTNVRNLTGGLIRWIEVYGKTVPTVTRSKTVAPPQTPPAAPRPTTLDQAAAEALVAEATEWLSDLTDDEDVSSAITERWKAREDLANKTRAQILKLLLDDVKTVITDKDDLAEFIKGWNAKTKAATPK